MRSCLALALSTSLSLIPNTVAMAATATYDISFEATWSGETHPDAYPSGAHFSPLVGAVHNDQVSFWVDGGLATLGVERMAELGATIELRSEIQTAISAGTTIDEILGDGIISSPGSTMTSVDVSCNYSLVTLVTMVAPSPDWFLGVSSLDLREGGSWEQQVIVELDAFDAGTDSGTSFGSTNEDTNPQEPIALLDAPLRGTPPLGSFTFTLVADTTIPGDHNCDDIVGLADLAIVQTGLGTDFDRTDLVEVARNLGVGAVASPAASSVPEPTTLTLAALSLCGCVVRWRRRR